MSCRIEASNQNRGVLPELYIDHVDKKEKQNVDVFGPLGPPCVVLFLSPERGRGGMKRFFQFYTRLGVKLVRYYFFRPVQLSQSLSGIEMGPGRETLWKMSQTTGVHYYFMIRHFLVF